MKMIFLLLILISASIDSDTQNKIDDCLYEIELQHDYLDKELVQECYEQ
jgi:hypothetical protein